MAVQTLADTFVSIVDRHDWKKLAREPESAPPLDEGEVQVILYTLIAAGFTPAQIVPGRLTGNIYDQDGPTGEKFPINARCPYKVVDEAGQDDYRATSWLEAMFCRVPDHGPVARAAWVQNEIDRSVPLEPIQLTADGDCLCEYPRDRGLVDHARDDHPATGCLGVHQHCGGFMDRIPTTKVFDALHCRRCHLRVVVPQHRKMYGQVRQYFKEKLEKVFS